MAPTTSGPNQIGHGALPSGTGLRRLPAPKGPQRNGGGDGRHEGIGQKGGGRGQTGEDIFGKGTLVHDLLSDKPQEERKAGHGEGGHQSGRGGERHPPADAADLPELPGAGLVIDAAHHHEQGGFIERVNQEEGDGRRQGRYRAPAQKHGHDAQRHDRGVGQNTFQVGPRHGHDSPPYRGHRADDDQCRHPGGGAPHDRMQPGQEIDAGFDHGGGMQKRAHGRRRGHGVRQPEMEGELGRFGEGPCQEAYQNGQIACIAMQSFGVPLQFGYRIGPRHVADQQDAHEQQQTAAAGNQQGLSGTITGRCRFILKTDQQKGKKGCQLPENKQQDEIVAENQPHHGQEKRLQIDKKTVYLPVTRQIGIGIDRHQKTDAGDNQDKQKAQPVQDDIEPDVQAGHPVEGHRQGPVFLDLRDLNGRSDE